MSKTAKGIKNGETFENFVAMLRDLHVTRYEGPFLLDNALGMVSMDIAAIKPVLLTAADAVAVEAGTKLAAPEPLRDDGITQATADLLYSSLR